MCPDHLSINLAAPSSSSGATLSFDSVMNLLNISAEDVGTYSVQISGPGGTTQCDTELALDPLILRDGFEQND